MKGRALWYVIPGVSVQRASMSKYEHMVEMAGNLSYPTGLSLMSGSLSSPRELGKFWVDGSPRPVPSHPRSWVVEERGGYRSPFERRDTGGDERSKGNLRHRPIGRVLLSSHGQRPSPKDRAPVATVLHRCSSSHCAHPCTYTPLANRLLTLPFAPSASVLRPPSGSRRRHTCSPSQSLVCDPILLPSRPKNTTAKTQVSIVFSRMV